MLDSVCFEILLANSIWLNLNTSFDLYSETSMDFLGGNSVSEHSQEIGIPKPSPTLVVTWVSPRHEQNLTPWSLISSYPIDYCYLR